MLATTASLGQELGPGDVFRDCPDCPEMVVVPAGSFRMGDSAGLGWVAEQPVHTVQIGYAFAVGRYEVTFDEWAMCRNDGACAFAPSDEGWGRGSRPVINVSWADAQQFAVWLSQKTGQQYRLLSEAEWEYAARAGMLAPYVSGWQISCQHANIIDCHRRTVSVGSYAPNAFGLYDMAGNVSEWTEDCFGESYNGAPTDGSAWIIGDCSRRVLRGASWANIPQDARWAFRERFTAGDGLNSGGFRVARDLE